MTIFTVHIPVEARDPERFADQIRLVPEKASLAAFFFGPVWLAAQGAYLAAGGFVLAVIALAASRVFLGLAAASRGRSRLVDVVNAATVEEGEHIALRRLISAQTAQPVRPAAPTYMRDPDLPGIGLFPGAGG